MLPGAVLGCQAAPHAWTSFDASQPLQASGAASTPPMAPPTRHRITTTPRPPLLCPCDGLCCWADSLGLQSPGRCPPSRELSSGLSLLLVGQPMPVGIGALVQPQLGERLGMLSLKPNRCWVITRYT